MKNIFRLLAITILAVAINSCQSKITKQAPETVIESQFYTDSLFSKNLSEYRKYNVYLPQNFSKEENYPIIYATDGSPLLGKNQERKKLDSIIENKISKPVIYIESHSNSKIADSTSMTTGDGRKVKLNYRNFEYTRTYENTHKDADLASRFKRHLAYFNDELISDVEVKLNQTISKEDRYFFGYSNGAGFGLNLLNNHPNTIGTYLCFSTFGGDAQTNEWNSNIDYPDLYLKYGSKEPEFLDMDAEFLKEKYKELDAFIDIEEFEGGHEHKIWEQEFIETLTKILKND